MRQPAIDAPEQRFPGIFERYRLRQVCAPRRRCNAGRWPSWLTRVPDQTNPPDQATSRFDDGDNGLWWVPYTDRLSELGVTAGCAAGPLPFCPDRAVTRGQMATFLVRALPTPPVTLMRPASTLWQRLV